MPTLEDAIEAVGRLSGAFAEEIGADDQAALAHALQLLEGQRWRPASERPKPGDYLILAHFSGNSLIQAMPGCWDFERDEWDEWSDPDFPVTHWRTVDPRPTPPEGRT